MVRLLVTVARADEYEEAIVTMTVRYCAAPTHFKKKKGKRNPFFKKKNKKNWKKNLRQHVYVPLLVFDCDADSTRFLSFHCARTDMETNHIFFLYQCVLFSLIAWEYR